MSGATLFSDNMLKLISAKQFARYFKNNPSNWDSVLNEMRDDKTQKLASADAVKAWHKAEAAKRWHNSDKDRAVKKWG